MKFIKKCKLPLKLFFKICVWATSVEALISELLILQGNKSFWKTREMQKTKTKIKQNPPNQPANQPQHRKIPNKQEREHIISWFPQFMVMTLLLFLYPCKTNIYIENLSPFLRNIGNFYWIFSRRHLLWR